MKQILMALCLVALTGCQTIRIQGVEVTKEQQVWAFAGLVAAGLIIHELADNDEPEVEKCAIFLPTPPGKGGFICAEDWKLDTYGE